MIDKIEFKDEKGTNPVTVDLLFRNERICSVKETEEFKAVYYSIMRYDSFNKVIKLIDNVAAGLEDKSKLGDIFNILDSEKEVVEDILTFITNRLLAEQLAIIKEYDKKEEPTQEYDKDRNANEPDEFEDLK